MAIFFFGLAASFSLTASIFHDYLQFPFQMLLKRMLDAVSRDEFQASSSFSIYGVSSSRKRYPKT